MFDLLELFGLRDFTSSNKQAPVQADMETPVDAGLSDLMPTQMGNIEDASASGPILSNSTQPAREQTPFNQAPSTEATPPPPASTITPDQTAEYLRTKNPDENTLFPSIQSIDQEVLDQQPTPAAPDLTVEPVVAQPTSVVVETTQTFTPTEPQVSTDNTQAKYINSEMNITDEKILNPQLNNDAPVAWPRSSTTADAPATVTQIATPSEIPTNNYSPDLTTGSIAAPEAPASQSYPTAESSPTVVMPEVSMPVTEVNPQLANPEQPVLPQAPITTEQPQQ